MQFVNFFWVGFYIVKNDELVLGPFQGTIACTRIKKGKGVCGTSWLTKETIIVENVDQFPGHIACSSASKSEIVIPIIKNNEVVAVLDIDDDNYSTFDKIDQFYLEQIVAITINWFK
jgi:GAF domain-containing protein